MFAEFNDTMFPDIRINLKLDNINDQAFNEFTQKWESYDERNTPYTFIFTSEGRGLKTTKYIKSIIIFIKKLKKRKKIQNNVFLSKSIMVCKTNFTKYLLKCIFSLSVHCIILREDPIYVCMRTVAKENLSLIFSK